jgi:hypothetical protein
VTSQTALLRTLLREVGDLRKQVTDQGRASQGAFRSVELTDIGRPTYYDGTGPVSKVVVDPNGGGAALVPVTAPPPAVPTDPDAVGVQGGINIIWDGTFIAANWSANVAHVEIHRGPAAGFEPEDLTQIGAFTSFYGGQHFWASQPEEGEQWFCLVTVDRTGRRSAPSGYAPATALRILPTSDGDAPATSPDATLRGGIGTLFASWTAINNEDPVTYEVHIAKDNAAFVPAPGDPATMVGRTGSTTFPIRTMPNGDALLYTSTYTVRVIARDIDGPAAPGGASSAVMLAITSADIAADFVYANDILANQITGGTLNATVLLAGLFRTATSGGRVEIGPFGIRIYDSNGVDINVDLGGVVNRFRGSIDATDIIIRDALQMFGKLNKMGAGAVLTLTSTTSAPAQAPTLSWEYEERPRPGGGAFMTSAWWSADETQSSATEVFWKSGWIQRNGVPWFIPQVVPVPGEEPWAERMPWHSNRIAENPGNGLLATYHQKYANNDAGFPKIMVGVWDDAAVPGGGAAVLKGELEVQPFSFDKTIVIAPRMLGGPGRNTFAAVTFDKVAKSIDWHDYQYTTAGGLVMTGYSGANAVSLASWASDEVITGCVFGTSTYLGIPDGGVPKSIILVMSNYNNYVFQFDGATYNVQPTLSWPTTYADQRNVPMSYDPYANNLIKQYLSMNWAAGADQKIYRYTASHGTGADTIWASYAWRGEATKAFRTEDSARSSIAYRRRARLRVNVPALPAPAAGVGAARDPNTDPYGWVYYLGHGAFEPADAGMYLQPAQPVMVPGVVLAQNNIALDVYPTWAGTNPVAASTFPASSPAQIRSDGNDGAGNPLLSIDGAGHARVQDLTLPTDVRTALAGKAARQLSYAMLAPQAIVGGGTKTTTLDIPSQTAKVKWGNRFMVIGAGRHADTAPSGIFEINYPPVGTSIQVHSATARTSVVAAADGIPLKAYETLWYELPFGAASTSQPGRFHVVSWDLNDSFVPPIGWVKIVSYDGDDYYAVQWADGTTTSGWQNCTLLSGWVNYGAVPGTGAQYQFLNGRVTVRYAIKSGSPNVNAFLIPSALAPGAQIHAYGRGSDGVSYDNVVLTVIDLGGGIFVAGNFPTYRFFEFTFIPGNN